jgi:ribonuclease J
MADELVFVPLGGLGEIGMNLGLYGFGPGRAKTWLMVDCGLSFAGPEQAGIDIILPDPRFIEKMRADLAGIVITHAHEDHIGAVADLWPRLKAPVYATRFAAGLLETKKLSEPNAPRIELRTVAQGARIEIGPFSVEFVPVAHSIPESCALAIRTPLGTILHSGDWKLDAEPGIGQPTDEARLRAIGAEGVLALVCDSTNILREGVSPSEAEVAATLGEIIRHATSRVLVTTFASNVARLRAVALAAQAAGRHVVLIGRAMERVAIVARECGYLDGVAPFLSGEALNDLPREKVVILATGSQGEPRAAVARISEDEHPLVKLAPGDMVIFSSRTIPGNEREVGRIINNLVRQGIEVVTDRTALIHASGHPRRGEVAQVYDWLRPQIAIPAHGEEIHLAEHYAFALERQVPYAIKARNGDIVLLGPGTPGIVGEAAHGRLARDGNLLLALDDESLRQRQSLAFAGVVTIALAVTAKGEMAGTPDVVTSGLPTRTRDGEAIDSLIDSALFDTFDSLPRQRRRDPDTVSTAIEKSVRAVINQAWGKRPLVHVLVVEI